ncbi:MAG: hypothetical protein DSZ28_02590 [Thiothrix sp.]|nr:MAG: hypothetical protein DSZ28_02590 [Thiothrix sp.]
MKKFPIYYGVCATLLLFACSVQADPPLEGPPQLGDDDQQIVASGEGDPGQAGGDNQVEEGEKNLTSEAAQPPSISEKPQASSGEIPEAAEGQVSSDEEVVGAVAESEENIAGWLVKDQEVLPDDAYIGALFGDSMAVSGNTWVIGADGGADHAGIVYIYTRNESGEWVRENKLVLENPANRGEYFYFGRSVAVNGDTLAVAVPGNVYVYSRTSEGWVQQAKLPHSAKEFNFNLATSVALSNDTLLVGGSVTESTRTSEGIVSVFTRDAQGNWTKAQDLSGPGERANKFGHTVAIDSDIAVVGDSLFDSSGNVQKGIFWVYQRNSLGDWERERGLGVGNDDGVDGVSVAISGNRIVVGGLNNTARVFELNDGGSLQQELSAVDGGDSTFGSSVAINGDLLVVGANRKKGGKTDAGVAYVFKRSSNGGWNQLTMLKDHTGGGLYQRPLGERSSITGRKFGSSVAIADGGNILVGATGGKVVWLSKPADSGFAYSFHLACQSSMQLLRNQWSMISLPCRPPADANTVGNIFGNLGLGEYDQDWAVYSYDPTSSYVKLSLDSGMSQGRGYWMIQNGNNESVQLSMPAGSTPTAVDVASYLNHDYDISKQCDSERGCFSVPLVNSSSTSQWNLLGHPFRTVTPLDRIHVVTDIATSPTDCSGTDGCTLAQGETDNILRSVFWSYKEGQYQTLGSGSSLNPWEGFFSAPLAGSNGSNAKLLISKE